MAYEIPPWLNQQGADPASAFVSAFSAASNAAAQRARLAQEAQETGLKLAMAEREQQRQAQLDYQKLEISKAYNDAQLGLREQQLITQQEKNAQQAVQAANTYAMRARQGEELADYRRGMLGQGADRNRLAAQKYSNQMAGSQEAQRRIAAGEDPRKVFLELGTTIAGGMTGMGSIVGGQGGVTPDFQQERAYDIPNLPGWKGVRTSRSSQQLVPPQYAGDYQAVPTGVEGVSVIPGAGASGRPLPIRHPTIKEPEHITKLRERIAVLSQMDPEEFGPLSAKELEAKMKQLEAYEASRGKKAAAPGQGSPQSGGGVMYFDPSAPGGLSTNAPSWAK